MNPAILIFLKRWGPMIGAALAFGMILSVAYCKGQYAGRSSEVIAQQEREIQTQQDIGKANEKAGDRRMEDTMRATEQEKELQNALATTNDPDRQRTLRGCIILRQQGRDPSGIPACR